MRTLPLLLLTLGLATPACGGDFCTKEYDKVQACVPRKARVPEKSEYIQSCQAEERKARQEGTFDEAHNQALAACLNKDECEQMMKCMSEASDVRYTKEQLAAIKQAEAGNDLEKMKEACQYITDEKPELVEACKPVMAKLVEVATVEVTKMRDAGKHDFSACGDLESYGKAAGSDAEKAAKALCAEAQAAQTASKALAEAAANIADRKASIPYECDASLKMMADMTSDWAKAKRVEVIEACFEDLGLVILEMKVPAMTYICEFNVKEVCKAVKAYSIDNAELNDWIAKAGPVCVKDS